MTLAHATVDVAEMRKLAQAAVNADNASREPGAHSFAMRAADEAEYEFRNAITPAHYLALLDRLERAEKIEAAARRVDETGAVLSERDPFDESRQWFAAACEACRHDDCAHVRAITSLRAALDDEAPR